MDRRQRHEDEHSRMNQPGWGGYRSSTSQFVEKVNPRFVRSEREIAASKGAKVTVYFIRFTSIQVPGYSFLKVGISNMKGIRFDFDSHRFTHQTLATITGLARGRALEIEADILTKFSVHKHIPKISLMSKGNSECLEDSKELQAEIENEFRVFGGKKIVPSPEIDPCIHNLMLMMNWADACGIETEVEKLISALRGNLKGLGIRVPSKEDLMVHFRRKIKSRLR